jgi:hypothetical protein
MFRQTTYTYVKLQPLPSIFFEFHHSELIITDAMYFEMLTTSQTKQQYEIPTRAKSQTQKNKPKSPTV